jgi:hypothetical protein
MFALGVISAHIPVGSAVAAARSELSAGVPEVEGREEVEVGQSQAACNHPGLVGLLAALVAPEWHSLGSLGSAIQRRIDLVEGTLGLSLRLRRKWTGLAEVTLDQGSVHTGLGCTRLVHMS